MTVGSLALLQVLARFRYVFLLLLAGALCVGSVHRLTGDSDWQFFSLGSGLLFGEHEPFVRASGVVPADAPGGFHLYGNYPFLQIGPPALLVARLVELAPGEGLTLAAVVVQALGLAAVYFAERAFGRTPTLWTRLTVVVGGGLMTVVWGSLTHYRHLDDAMALAAFAAAAWCLQESRVVTAGLLLGLGAACKPWAVVLLALALVPRDARGKLLCGATAVLTTTACWLPFVIADHRTLQLGQVTLVLTGDSALAALQLGSLPAPQALRLLQLGIGLALACLLVLRSRWPAAVLVAFAWRLALEPSTYPYYAAALVTAALVADLARDRALPVLTTVAALGWAIADRSSGGTAGGIRLLTCAGLALLALLPVQRCRAVTGQVAPAPSR